MSAVAQFLANPAASLEAAPSLSGSVELMEAQSEAGLSAVLFPMPDNPSVTRALLMCPRTGPRAALEMTGQGAGLALLVDLCGAFASGNALLQSPAECPQLAKLAALFTTPLTPGQDVDVYRAKGSSRWLLLAARPSQHATGFNMYVQDAGLVERCARAFVEGRLRARAQPHVADNGAAHDW